MKETCVSESLTYQWVRKVLIDDMAIAIEHVISQLRRKIGSDSVSSELLKDKKRDFIDDAITMVAKVLFTPSEPLLIKKKPMRTWWPTRTSLQESMHAVLMKEVTASMDGKDAATLVGMLAKLLDSEAIKHDARVEPQSQNMRSLHITIAP